MVETIKQDLGGDCLLPVPLLNLFVGDLLIIHLSVSMFTHLSELFLYSNNRGHSDGLKCV